jgi:hypothetical protein
MNAAIDIATAKQFITRIEDAEAKKRGIRVDKARPFVARRLGTAPGTLEGIRRLRTKIVPNWLMARMKAQFVSLLQEEIARLEHEITVAQQVGSHHSDDALQAAQAQMVAAKEILRVAR